MALDDASPRIGDSTIILQSDNSQLPAKQPRSRTPRARKRTRLFKSLLDALGTKKGFKRVRRIVLNLFGLAFLIVVNLFGLAFVIVRYGEWLYRELSAAFGWQAISSSRTGISGGKLLQASPLTR